jgi:hypothetical protein
MTIWSATTDGRPAVNAVLGVLPRLRLRDLAVQLMEHLLTAWFAFLGLLFIFGMLEINHHLPPREGDDDE